MTTKRNNIEQIKAHYQKVILKNKKGQVVCQEEAKKLCKAIGEKFINGELGLRDRQEDSLIKLADNEASRGYFHACTAFGKTYLIMAIAESYRSIEKNKKIIIFEENQTVLEQIKQDFIEKTSFNSSSIGVFYGKEKTSDTDIIIATYASMEKLVNKVGVKNIGLVLCDEAHHILSENRKRVVRQFSNSLLYGFTATPDYNEDKNCEQVFGKAIDVITLQEGINKGLLCSSKNGLLISQIPVDLTTAINSTGDYDAEKLEEIFKISHLHGIREELADYYLNGSDEYLGRLKGKTTIINAPNQNEANRLAEVFNQKARQTIAKAYHANTPKEVLEEFNQNAFPVLIQVNRVTEGYSNPKIELCINYPTCSRVRAAQRSGRALRSDIGNPHKMALVVDICFKKSDKKSALEEIRANRQVLFQDIAQDIMLCSSNFREHYHKVILHRSDTTSERSSIESDRLFDIITSYEELYSLVCDKLINTEQFTYDETSHLKYADFVRGDWALIKNGRKMIAEDRKEINDMFERAHIENPNLVYKGNNCAYITYFFDKFRIKEVLSLRAFANCEMKLINDMYSSEYNKEFYLQNKDFMSQGDWRLIKNGREMATTDRKEINDMFERAHNENPDLVYEDRYRYFFAKSRIGEVLKLKAFSGCEMKLFDELYSAKYDEKLHLKSRDFSVGNWGLIKAGRKMTAADKKEINKLFEQAHLENPNLVFQNKRTSGFTYFFDKSRIKEILALQAFANCEMKEPSELETIVYNEKLHIKYTDFFSRGNLALIKDGRKISCTDYTKINEIFEQAHLEDPNLVYKGKKGSRNIYFFNKSCMDEVLMLKSFSGCEIKPLSELQVTKYNKERHLKNLDFSKGDWALIKDGRKMAADNYKEIKTMFECAHTENPDLIFKNDINGGVVYFFDKSRIPEVLALETFANCEMKLLKELYTVEYDKERHLKMTDFSKGDWALVKNGKKISCNNKKEINLIFASAHAENPNLVFKGKDGGKDIFFFDKSHIQDVLALKSFTNCKIKAPTQCISNIIAQTNFITSKKGKTY